MVVLFVEPLDAESSFVGVDACRVQQVVDDKGQGDSILEIHFEWVDVYGMCSDDFHLSYC